MSKSRDQSIKLRGGNDGLVKISDDGGDGGPAAGSVLIETWNDLGGCSVRLPPEAVAALRAWLGCVA